jgi:hypothetical protein
MKAVHDKHHAMTLADAKCGIQHECYATRRVFNEEDQPQRWHTDYFEWGCKNSCCG